VENPPERKFLAYFRGTIFHREGNAYSRGLRPRLHALFANETDLIYGTKKKDCDRKVRETNAVRRLELPQHPIHHAHKRRHRLL
jgi:hypothetical protein